MTTLLKEKIKDEEKEQYFAILLKMKECGLSSIFIFERTPSFSFLFNSIDKK